MRCKRAADAGPIPTVALTGNPNVGKSTLFNALTGLRQHTGNWPGKTVEAAEGRYRHNGRTIRVVDLPGTYSLAAHSPEEMTAERYLLSGQADAAVVVCDAVCLERNLLLVLQVLSVAQRTVVCLNLMDEAERKGIRIDIPALREILGVEVVGISARRKRTIAALTEAVERCLSSPPDGGLSCSPDAYDFLIQRISRSVIRFEDPDHSRGDLAMDRILTGRISGVLLMILLLSGVLWLTICGANFPSRLLMKALFHLGDRLSTLLLRLGVLPAVHDALIHGVWRTLAWVVSVMLPPMAIFFPLFTLLEDAGFLPRIAFNLDHAFERSGACGKQALTMCMGFGCNAVGAAGSRIIDSPRERLLAILTNSLVPCNGRFPILIGLAVIFFSAHSSLGTAAVMTALLLLSVGMTFAVTALLSKTLLRGEPSAFTLELPPYRPPQLGQVLIRSLLDRTLFVLGRAAAVAAPAGLIVWALANTGGDVSLLRRCAELLDPPGRMMGMDGAILLAFILGCPANETVIPILLMIYLSAGTMVSADVTQIGEILSANGWTRYTALAVMLFTLLHWPCTTTMLTIRRETGSRKWTMLSALIPTVCGAVLCTLLQAAVSLFV